MQRKRKLTLAHTSGIRPGCPFCTAATLGIPKLGQRLRIISGNRAGQTGVALKGPGDSNPDPFEFSARMDDESGDDLFRVMLQLEFIQPLPATPVPQWAPPLSLRDTAELHSVLITFCDDSLIEPWEIYWPAFYDLIGSAWVNRLPIKADELWPVLKAHGVPDEWEKELADFFTRGMDLLVRIVGRRVHEQEGGAHVLVGRLAINNEVANQDGGE